MVSESGKPTVSIMWVPGSVSRVSDRDPHPSPDRDREMTDQIFSIAPPGNFNFEECSSWPH